MKVKPKKHLGQHFLHDKGICERISNSVINEPLVNVLEIGPGTGALTVFLKQRFPEMKVIDIDEESIVYLVENNVLPKEQIIFGDFLQMDASEFFGGKPFVVAGNFPYNISSQILFKVIEARDVVPEMVGMFQKEVAVRIASGPGNKDYGILSVLSQAFYDIKYLFTVNEGSFNPPPKVKSGVIRMQRKADYTSLGCDVKLFFTVVKTAFNQRRKTLKNSLSGINPKKIELPYESKRPEQLDVKQFVELTNALSV